MKKLLSILFIAAAGSIAITSCVKKNFDNPPDTTNYDPRLPVTHTIAQLKAMNGLYISSTNFDTTLITDDVVVAGIVSADDRSGNYYKQIVIQDSTGGIAVDIDAYSLYNDYPVGRKVYIKCKGLYLGYNGGTPELGAGIDAQKSVLGMNGSTIGAHIVKADVGHAVKDTVVSFAAVRAMSAATTSSLNPLINRLVTISDSVEFDDPNVTYTEPTATTNRYITQCAATSTQTIVVRSSNYANFHAIPVPTGRGQITAILTIYKTSSTTPQLIIRDTSDVKFYGSRCGTGGPAVPMITVDSLRKLYPGTGNYTIGSARVTGVVISDMSKGNVSTGNFIIEDGSKKSIILYMPSASYNLGDSLVIDATAAKLQLFNGAMELTGVTASKIVKAGTGKTVTPVQLTIAQLNAAFAQYENVLVKVVNATIAAGGTYSGNKTLTDGTGSISLYTAPAAAFASTPVFTTPKTYVGIATLFTPNEIKLRDPAIDVY